MRSLRSSWNVVKHFSLTDLPWAHRIQKKREAPVLGVIRTNLSNCALSEAVGAISCEPVPWSRNFNGSASVWSMFLKMR